MIKYKIWSTWNRPTCVVVSLLSQGRSIRDLLEIIQATARENNKGHEIYWNMRTSSLKKWNSGWRLTKSQFCKGTGGLGGEMRGLKGHGRKMSVCRWPGCNELDTLKNLKEERSSWTVRRTVRLRAEWQAGLLCTNGPWHLSWKVPLVPQHAETQPTFTLRCRSKIAFSWGNSVFRSCLWLLPILSAY